MELLQLEGTVRPGAYLYQTSTVTHNPIPQNGSTIGAPQEPTTSQTASSQPQWNSSLTGSNMQQVGHASTSMPQRQDRHVIGGFVSGTYHAGDRFARQDLVPLPPETRPRQPRRPNGYHCNNCSRAFDRQRDLK